MAGVIGQGVEQSEQQGRRRDDVLEQLGQEREVILADLERLQFVLLKGAQVGEQIEGNPEHQKTAEAIAKRDEQFAQQVAVKQTHLRSRVAKRPDQRKRPPRRSAASTSGAGEVPSGLG